MILVLLVNLILATSKLKQHHLNHQVMFKREREVVVLNLYNFDAALMRFEVLLVDFYAPWCPHWLEPQFAEAAEILKEQRSKITLAKVDCTQQSVLCSKFEVRGYPTLRIFYHDKIYHYHGGRDAQGIVRFMINHLKEEQELEKEQEKTHKEKQSKP